MFLYGTISYGWIGSIVRIAYRYTDANGQMRLGPCQGSTLLIRFEFEEVINEITVRLNKPR